MSGQDEGASTPGEEYEKLPLSRNVTSQPVRDGDDQELRRIASAFSFPQRQTTIKEDPELYEDEIIKGTNIDDPTLDPTSGSFDSYKWAKNVLSVLNKEGISLKKASIVFKDLNVSGTGSALQLQKNVLSPFMAPFRAAEYLNIGSHRSPEKQILQDFDGCLKSGELLMVLGRPGSGCSTLLKSICGQMKGLKLQEGSSIHYGGIPSEKMHKEFKGEVIYNQEVDKHFANLTVGQTLEFAASARTPQARPHSMTREQFIKYTTSITMAVYGLSHTYNTNVGSDYVRGVSGGERKRVSIAEMALAGAPISAWDNSTRGLDAATALEFVKSLRMSADLFGSCHTVAIYQASQAIYDVFDKVVVLYEGRQIYYGSCDQAGEYFKTMGWYCPPRQTTGDFLTSITNPLERKPREGFEKKVPRTAEDFAKYWRNSREYAALKKEIDQHESDFPIGDDAHLGMREAKTSEQSKHLRPQSPYIISIPMQIKICTKRSFQRLWNSKSGTIAQVVSQIVMALIVGSIFFGTPDDSAVFFSKGAAIFLAILFNALSSISEINTLYDQRPIVEKHASYAFYHPFADAFGSIVSDIPVKFVTAIFFNIVLYFMVGLRQEAAQFFIYFLFAFISTLCMSVMFRTLAAATKTLAQAMALSGIMVLAINIYTGFSVTVPYMKVWFSWIRFINPVFYGFEALIANEFHGRRFPCATYVPPLSLATGNSFICSSVGAVEGETYVSGDTFIAENYQYYYSHIWRNLGIIIAFWIGFFFAYLLATELNSSFSSSAEFLVFRRGQVPAYMRNTDKRKVNDESVETPEKAVENDDKNDETNILSPQRDFFTWRNVCYDISTKDGHRRLLDNVSGWIKPGTLTALMGVSGAGKTTLLDVLAQRVSMGVITGDMLVNGNALPASFQRNTGYCQQQDLHLETTTVREALQFSAILRQAKTVSKQEKLDYVESVVKMLNMNDFADAVVGKTGEGLNVEQRKLLSIGVELAAKPKLLLFLDEPTSGLDSQSSWSICSLLRSLAENGQAILCTIHQPSAILFQEFDRLLFLAQGGKTVYFGDIGEESRTLLDYFESNGARHCDDSENPAEYMLEVIGAGASGESKQDWPTVWNNSQEAKDVQNELDRIHKEMSPKGHDIEDEDNGEFAMPFSTQLWEVTRRVFQQYWVQPGYIYSKLLLGVAAALFIGFSFFKPDSSQQGLQTALFSVFQLMAIFSTIVQQIIPKFITQRSLYEVRERPAKTYSWPAFLIANIVVEIPWQIFLGVLVWASFYFSVFTANQTPEQQGLMVLFCVELFVFASTFADFITAAIPNGETAGSVVTLLFALSLIFSGVLQPPGDLPGFWIFMYRVSPLTYLIAGMTATGLHGREVQCSSAELSVIQPPSGQSCGQYLATYLQTAPGQLYNPSSMTDCQYCPLSSADQYLASSNIYFSERWRNFGILLAYIGFNIFAATAMYYLFRVKQWRSSKITHKASDAAQYVEQLFKVREGKTPKGREAENDRVF